MAKKYYKNKPSSNREKASAVAWNFAVLPLVLINSMFLPYILEGKWIGASGMAYLLPIIYSPIIYVVVFLLSYLYLWKRV